MLGSLTVSQINASGNRIISCDPEAHRILTQYGKETFNIWQSYDEGRTYVNIHCYTKLYV
jgi:hypothetical protein